MKVGDKVKIGTGRQIWTILYITDRDGYKILSLENPTGTSHRLSYMKDAKLVEG